GKRGFHVTGVQTCALTIYSRTPEEAALTPNRYRSPRAAVALARYDPLHAEKAPPRPPHRGPERLLLRRRRGAARGARPDAEGRRSAERRVGVELRESELQE